MYDVIWARRAKNDIRNASDRHNSMSEVYQHRILKEKTNTFVTRFCIAGTYAWKFEI